MTDLSYFPCLKIEIRRGYHLGCMIRTGWITINLRKENLGSIGQLIPYYQSNLDALLVMTQHSQVFTLLIRIHDKIDARKRFVPFIIL